jgi:SAM-dependent methyltransferase
LFPGRFRDLADHDTTGRPTHPSLLARRVTDMIGLDGTGRVLDLGPRPGFLAVDFHRFACEMMAVDPKPGMLRVARANRSSRMWR